jgi:hypothetical protein
MAVSSVAQFTTRAPSSGTLPDSVASEMVPDTEYVGDVSGPGPPGGGDGGRTLSPHAAVTSARAMLAVTSLIVPMLVFIRPPLFPFIQRGDKNSRGL